MSQQPVQTQSPATPPVDPRPGASTTDLLKDLGDNVGELVRKEVSLAAAELGAKAKAYAAGAASFSVATVLLLYLIATLTVAAIAALAIVFPVWASALIVSGAYAVVIAIGLLAGAWSFHLGAPPEPEQTLETVKEDVEWAKTRMTSASR